MSDIERTEFNVSGNSFRDPLGGVANGHFGGGGNGAQRDADALAQVGEVDAESNLRPKSLGEFIDQPKVRERLDLVPSGARGRNMTPDHVLLSGPSGLGKTTMAMIIAQEMGSSLRVTSGPALICAGDLAVMLLNLPEGDILFVDETHHIARLVEEMFYMAMEDFRINVTVGKGPGATSIPLEIPPLTPVDTTTRSGMLTGPLRDRFGFTARMEFYEVEDLTKVVTRAARILGVDISPEATVEIASRSHGTPRVANRPLRRVRDFTDAHSGGIIGLGAAKAALIVFDVDELGLDRLDCAVLTVLAKGHSGGPVGVNSLALAVGEEPSTTEEVCESYLVRVGMTTRTSRGRVVTARAWRHLRL